MERLDYFDILPKGMDAYLSNHGYHFSRAMAEWAVSMMRDRNGNKIPNYTKQKVDEILRTNGVIIENTKGYYDPVYVYAMVKADYIGSSIMDENHAAKFVKDFLDDIDGNPTRAFDEFYINCIAKGIDIPWEELI